MPRLSVCINPDDPRGWFENENIDFCCNCWPPDLEDVISAAPDVAPSLIERAFLEEDVVDGCEHPPYDDCDYRCATCRKLLSSEDD